MTIHIKTLGLQPYETTWQAMQTFTHTRQANTPDELWIVEHPAVFTQGLNGKPEHLLHTQHTIPVLQTDRGGQITFHAPGQLILYILFDLKRAKLSVRALITIIEESLIDYLSQLNIHAYARQDAPGVYVNQQKIASLGLKIHKQKSYHGLALNINMDLSPFTLIRPCGLTNMTMTQIADLIQSPIPTLNSAGNTLSQILIQRLQPSPL